MSQQYSIKKIYYEGFKDDMWRISSAPGYLILAEAERNQSGMRSLSRDIILYGPTKKDIEHQLLHRIIDGSLSFVEKTFD